MITYTARDLVKRARQLADLENSDFISWNEQINLLNENYVALYQKLCNIGDKAFLKTVHVGNGETELPADFFQLKSVSLYNNGNIIPVLRRSETQSYNDRYYDIRNGNIYIGGYSGDYVLDYYPEPMTLTFKPDSIELGTTFLDYKIKGAYDKIYLNSELDVLDLETSSSLGKFPDPNFINSRQIFVMDDQYIVSAHANMNYRTGTSNYDSNGAWSLNTAFTVVIDGKIYAAKYNSTEKKVYYYSSQLDLFGNCELGSFDYECNSDSDEYRFIFTNADFTDIWEFTQPLFWRLLHNGVEIDGVNHYLYFGQVILHDGTLWFVSNGGYTSAFKGINADNEIVSIRATGKIYAINKFDCDTGFGYTVNRDDNWYIDSFLEDTVLDFPNTFYYNILSYYLAIAFKLKQGGDVTGLSALLAQQEQTFFDTLTNDDYGPIRISNVY